MRDIVSPYPNDRPLLPAVVRMSNIASSSAENIYGRGRSSLLHMWTATQEAHQELQNFSSAMQKEFGFGLTGNVPSGSLGIDQIFFTTCKMPLVFLRTILAK